MDRDFYIALGRCEHCGHHAEVDSYSGLCEDCAAVEATLAHMIRRCPERVDAAQDIWRLATARVRRLYAIKEAQCIQ